MEIVERVETALGNSFPSIGKVVPAVSDLDAAQMKPPQQLRSKLVALTTKSFRSRASSW